MNVRELIAQLSALDPDLPVLVSRDQEGNGFLPLDEVESSAAIHEAFEWQVLHPDYEDEYTDELVRVVVLWP
jgi:hypothetical protein